MRILGKRKEVGLEGALRSKEDTPSPSLGPWVEPEGLGVSQEGPGLDHEGEVDDVGNFASEVSLNVWGRCSRVA